MFGQGREGPGIAKPRPKAGEKLIPLPEQGTDSSTLCSPFQSPIYQYLHGPWWILVCSLLSNTKQTTVMNFEPILSCKKEPKIYFKCPVFLSHPEASNPS